MNNKLLIYLIILIAILAVPIGLMRLDPDFGWHYRTGEYILKNGIPRQDIFSYTMPTFHFINHEWLTDIIITKLYDKAGFIYLGLISAILLTASIILVIPKKTAPYAIIPLLLGAPALLARGGVRPQILDWFFVALIIAIIQYKTWWEKLRFAVPLIFIAWANLHGGFHVGLLILGLVWITEVITTKKPALDKLGVTAASAAATFINPYGITLWYEVWQTITDTSLRWTIVEWQPFFSNAEFHTIALGVLVIVLTKKFHHYIPTWQWVTAVVWFLLGLTSVRHQAIFIIAAIPACTNLISQLPEVLAKDDESKRRAQKFLKLVTVIAALFFVLESILNMVSLFKDNLFNKETYPQKAINVINIPTNENLFSSYGWGGYLIWKLPNQKVFIDGRMPSWRRNLWPLQQETPPNESEYAFRDYRDIVEKGNYKPYFKKYNITTVLWPKKEVEELQKKPKSNPDHFIRKLEQDGWKNVYEDETAVIFRPF